MKKRRSTVEELERLSFHRPDRAAAAGRKHLASLAPDNPERIRVLVQIATALSQGQQLDEAERHLDLIDRESKVAIEWQVRAGLVRANLMIRRDDPAGAAVLVYDLITTTAKQNLNALVLRAMALRAKALVMAGDGIEALRIALHVRDLVREGASPDLHFYATEALGFVYVVLKDNERAQEPYREALRVARRLGQDVKIAGCASNLGAACTSLDLLDEGLHLLNEAEDAAARAGCLRLLVYAIWRTAYIYIYRRDLEGVRSTVDRGLQYVDQLGESPETASVLLLNTQVLLYCEEREEGMREGEQTLCMARRLHDEDLELATLATLAPCWEEEGRAIDAIDAYKRILEIKRAREDRFDPRSLERLAMQHESMVPKSETPESRRYDRSFEAQQLALRHPELTPIELTVCGGVLRGETSQEIAEALALSVHTIDTHRRRIRRKLGLQREESLHTALLVTAAA